MPGGQVLSECESRMWVATCCRRPRFALCRVPKAMSKKWRHRNRNLSRRPGNGPMRHEECGGPASHRMRASAVPGGCARFKGQTRECGETCGTVSRPTEGRNSSRREIDDASKKPSGGESATGNSFKLIRSENAPPAFPANAHGELDLAGNRRRRSDPRRAFDISAREPRAPRATRLAHCAGQLEPAIHFRRHCGPAQPTQRCRQVARHPSD